MSLDAGQGGPVLMAHSSLDEFKKGAKVRGDNMFFQRMPGNKKTRKRKRKVWVGPKGAPSNDAEMRLPKPKSGKQPEPGAEAVLMFNAEGLPAAGDDDGAKTAKVCFMS